MEKLNDIIPLFGHAFNIDEIGPERKFVEFEKDANEDYQFKNIRIHVYHSHLLKCEKLTLKMKIDALNNMKKYLMNHVTKESEILVKEQCKKITGNKRIEYKLDLFEKSLKTMQDSLEDV